MKNHLTILSFGGGQDSTAILLLLIFVPEFRHKYAPGELIVIMSETGNEHESTYRHLKFTKDLCAKHGIPFFHITPDLGFHGSATDLVSYWRSTNSIGSKRFPKTCTDRLKIRPIYKFIDRFLSKKIQVKGKAPKSATKEFAQANGKIRVLIGIAKGEEKRVADHSAITEIWRRESFEYSYPLIDLGMDRQACQDSIRSFGMEVPYPSNCVLCPFMNEVELLWLKRFSPSSFALWVELEANKLRAHAHLGAKNLGVWGVKTLPEKMMEVEKKFGHMTDAELDEYKFSHGHCVASKY